MCTVSYIKHKKGFSLTSNRDEQSTRPTEVPKCYDELGQQLVYPKDIEAGGTWIATSDKNVSVCLLNGAFERHKRQTPYAKSRGIVLKERFQHDSNLKFIEQVNLENVEPFTLLMIDHDQGIDFKVLVWDAYQKHIQNVDSNQHHIWASSTLYDKEMRKNRQEWFKTFIHQKENIRTEDIINFHGGSFTDEKENDMVMKRNQDLKTLSISQINILKNSKNFIYKDLESNSVHDINLESLCKTV